MRQVYIHGWNDSQRETAKLHQALRGELRTTRPPGRTTLKKRIAASTLNYGDRADAKLRKF